jgi:hypothetical protein
MHSIHESTSNSNAGTLSFSRTLANSVGKMIGLGQFRGKVRVANWAGDTIRRFALEVDCNPVRGARITVSLSGRIRRMMDRLLRARCSIRRLPYRCRRLGWLFLGDGGRGRVGRSGRGSSFIRARSGLLLHPAAKRPSLPLDENTQFSGSRFYG